MAEDTGEVVEDQSSDETGTVDESKPAADEAFVVSIGDEQVNAKDEEPEEEEVQKAPAWVKKTRELNRKLEKEKRDLERDLRETKRKLNESAPQKELEIGPEPKLDDPDIDYDTEKFKKKMAVYISQEQAVNAKKAEVEQNARKEQEKWASKLASYQKAREEIKVDDFEGAESAVADLLNQTQRGIIIHGAKDPALVVYALGKSPAKAKEIAAINDPIEFAFAIARLEAQVKVEKKPAVNPERRVTGNAGLSGVTDNTLERLREEASRTGDYSKVSAYKKQLREKRGA